MQFTATCASGLEDLTAGEISQWGGKDIEKGRGSVGWSGTLESGYRACLWSRFSSRILLRVGEIGIESADELYEKAKLLPWEEHFGENDSFAVDCTIAKDGPITHSRFAALRTKDAVVDRFRERTGQRPQVQIKRPDVRLNVHVGTEKTLISIDLSGEGLHRRGYRSSAGQAPLKETLAAALVALSGWNRDEPLVDPLCGSGTILIEAALMAGDSAPGLGRSYFGFTGWRGHRDGLWSKLVEEAVEREQKGQHQRWPPLVGFDADSAVVGFARDNIRRAGLEGKIEIKQQQLLSLTAISEKGCLICNPPYGERLSEQEVVKYLYRFLGGRLQESFSGWKIGLFTMKPENADFVNIPWQRNYRLYNGPLPCRLYTGTAGAPPPRFKWDPPLAGSAEQGQDFANRLIKNFRQKSGWAEKNGIDCFRLYDRDLPEYNVTIDLFSKWLFIHEFPSPSSIDQAVAKERLNTVLAMTRAVLGVGRDRVYLMRHTRKGDRNAQAQKKKVRLHEVRERGCSYLLDFTGSSDVGLFLDQRSIREVIGGRAAGADFLNLFSHAGSMTVSAAQGGAVRTTSIDQYDDNLLWMEKNFALNGMYPQYHQLVQAEALEWLKQEKKQYDLIFAGMYKSTFYSRGGQRFDTKTQHGELIRLAMARLKEQGTLYFSTPVKSFRFEPGLEKEFTCVNISHNMIPKDFERHRRVHQHWEIRWK